MTERNGQRTLWFTVRGLIVELVPLASLYKGGSYPNWDGNESNGRPMNGDGNHSTAKNDLMTGSSPEALAPSNLPTGVLDVTQ